MTRTLDLKAAAGPTGQPHLKLTAMSVAVDMSSRIITAVIAPYGPVGYTNMGPTVYQAGFLNVPDDLRSVKLLVQHDQYAAAVGVGRDFTAGTTEAVMSFYLPEGAAGDLALQEADNGLRDGVSIGATITDWQIDGDNNLVVLGASLYEVSLVTIPAFSDARVLDVAAARKELPTVTLEQLRVELAAGRITQAEFDIQAARFNGPVVPATADPAPTPNDAAGAAQLAVVAANQYTGPMPTATPQEAPVLSAGMAKGMDLRAAANATLAHLRDNGVAGLAAELEDIIVDPANGSTEATHRPVFLGELWTASRIARPLIDSMSKGDLTGVKVYGWRWVEGPKVEEYAGKKTDVPSNEWKMETAEADAQPFAGGWDIERKYIDLGAAGIVEVAYAKATDDYKLKSEAYAARLLIAAATAVPAQASLTNALAELGTRAATIGATISYVQFGATAWAEFVNLKSGDVPWWLRSQGEINLTTTSGNAGGIRFSVNPALAARQILAGDGQASTWYEVAVPIRVRAENIPQGGIDLGVFGYGALIINDARAIFKSTINAPAAGSSVVIVNGVDNPVNTREVAGA